MRYSFSLHFLKAQCAVGCGRSHQQRSGNGQLRVGWRIVVVKPQGTLELANRNCSVLGVIAVPRDAEAGAQMTRELAAHYEAKQIRPRIAKTLDFAEVPRALVDLEARRISGKQVIRIATGD